MERLVKTVQCNKRMYEVVQYSIYVNGMHLIKAKDLVLLYTTSSILKSTKILRIRRWFYQQP